MAYLTQMSLLKKNKILRLDHFVLITAGMTIQPKQLMRFITTTVLVQRHKLCYSNILRDDVWNSYYWSTRLQYFAYTLSQSHRTYPSSGCYSLAVVAVHLLKLCCSLCCDPDYLQHAFFALISALCCPRSWAQAEWIFNHIRDTFPANELQWVEWVWNSADYWRSRQFQVHVVSTHRGRVTHICVGNLTITGSDNGLSPGRRQAIIWTNARI